MLKKMNRLPLKILDPEIASELKITSLLFWIETVHLIPTFKHLPILYYSTTNKYILQLLQWVPTKPSRQPPVHSPLTWSQRSLIKQCLLQ